MRGVAVGLGSGLLLLWIAGLVYEPQPWVPWLDAVVALGAFGMAVLIERRRETIAAAGFLSVALYVLWGVAMSTGARDWLAWWNFAFACAFLLLALSAVRFVGPMRPRRV